MLKEKWKTYYHGPCSREEELQAFYMLELSEEELSPGEESEEQEDNDYYVDLTGLIMDLQAAERQEYGKSNLKSGDGFEESVEEASGRTARSPTQTQGGVRSSYVTRVMQKADTNGPRSHRRAQELTLRCRPIPLNEEDQKETMRQIYECCDVKLMSRYEGKEFPKHCSPCFLVAKPASSAKRLVVHYAKLNGRLKRHSGSIPNLERAIERAAETKYKIKLDKCSGFWQIDLTE